MKKKILSIGGNWNRETQKLACIFKRWLLILKNASRSIKTSNLERVKFGRAFLFLACALILIESGSSQEKYQHNWEPNRYKVECAWNNFNCLKSLYPKIEGNLEEVVGRYKADGWKAQVKFGPLDETGTYTKVTDKGIADEYFRTETDESDCKTATVQFGKRTAEIENRPHWLFYFVAHEIFHVTQHTYDAFNKCKPARHGWVQESLATAVGLDFARRRFPDEFPIVDPTGANVDQMEREILSDAGGREYYLPLNLIEKDANQKEINSGDTRHYRTSGLWRHIAEVYHNTSYKFVQKYLARRPLNQGWPESEKGNVCYAKNAIVLGMSENNDWLDWAHKNVCYDEEIKKPFARVFALYMADVANWYRQPTAESPGGPAMYFDEAQWHKILYDGCLKLKLSESNPHISLDIKIQRASARCIQVTAEGLKPGERKAINVGVFSEYTNKNYPPLFRTEVYDALQLSLANSTDKDGLDCSKDFRSKGETRLRALNNCVFGFNTGTILVKGGKNEGRIWNVVPQETEVGKTSFTNTYILSRMAANPTDVPSADDGGAVLGVSAVFILDSPDAAIDGTKFGNKRTIGLVNRPFANYLSAAFVPTDSTTAIFGQTDKTVRIVGHLNGSPANFAQETVPVFGQDGKQAVATVTPGAVTPSAPVLDIFPVNPLFSSPGKPANTNGIWMLRWTAVEVEEEGMYQQTLVERDYIAAMPLDSNGKDPRPLQIGDSGEFKAMVTARVGLKTLYTRTPATLKVDEYSLYVLRARLEGTLCEAPLESRRRSDECVNPQPISATMVKAFAGLHDPSSRFIIEDTPATQQYARARQALMNEALNQTSTETPMPPDVEAGPSDDGAVVIRGCTCSCDDMPYLQKLEKYFKSGEKLSSSVMQRFQKMMRCMAPCTPHYQSCKLKLR